MIIRSANVSMGSSRQYASKAVQGAGALIGWAQQTQEVAAEKEGDRFRELLNGKGKNRSVTDGGGLWNNSFLKRYSTVSQTERTEEKTEGSSIEQIRRQTLYYLLRRIHEIFYGVGSGMQHAQGIGYGGYNAGGQLVGAYSEYYGYEETEETAFETTGKVVNADGREIDFNVSLSMSRSFAEYYEQTHEIYAQPAVSLCDPLVINLDGNIAEVSDQKIRFDLDADGKEDSISRLNGHSGYLALDRNGDGKIGDGSELFGTKSGDGFADLAEYDADGNGWIDEADPVFEKLKIWVTDADGREHLYRLKEKDIGAICLANAATDFDLRSMEDNALSARIRKTGIFLYENGMAGTVQHVDLARSMVATA